MIKSVGIIMIEWVNKGSSKEIGNSMLELDIS